MTGKLYLVGVGPGDPELLTLKAARILSEADCIAFPQKPGQGSMALDIARAHIADDKRLPPIHIPMELERAPAQMAYDQGAAHIAALIGEGHSVAYLCEGDPLFYGSAMFLIERLTARTEINIVPGVTSLTAAAAVAARPLAARNDRLKILPAPLDNKTLRTELDTSESVAIIKVGRHFHRLRKLLMESGHDKAVVVEHATGTREQIRPLAEFADDERPYFSIILSYRGGEAWAE